MFFSVCAIQNLLNSLGISVYAYDKIRVKMLLGERVVESCIKNYVQMRPVFSCLATYRIAETLAGENIGKFGVVDGWPIASFLLQFYRTFNLRIYLEEAICQGILPQIAEFAKVFSRQCFPLYGIHRDYTYIRTYVHISMLYNAQGI